MLNGGGPDVSTQSGVVTLNLHTLVRQLAATLGISSQVAAVQSMLQGSGRVGPRCGSTRWAPTSGVAASRYRPLEFSITGAIEMIEIEFSGALSDEERRQIHDRHMGAAISSERDLRGFDHC